MDTGYMVCLENIRIWNKNLQLLTFLVFHSNIIIKPDHQKTVFSAGYKQTEEINYIFNLSV